MVHIPLHGSGTAEGHSISLLAFPGVGAQGVPRGDLAQGSLG